MSAPHPTVTVHHVIRAYGRITDGGWGRTAFDRRRYRVHAGDWGHASKSPRVHRARGLDLGDNGPAWTVLGACLALLATEPDEQAYLVLPQAATGIIHRVVTELDLTPFRGEGADLVRDALPALRRAQVEACGRREVRHMGKYIGDGVPEEDVPLLADAARSARAGLDKTRARLPPVTVTEPGWTTDYGHSPAADVAAIAFTYTDPTGSPQEPTRLVPLPAAPTRNGELVGTLLAYRYARAAGLPTGTFYTDMRDSLALLRRFVADGRSPKKYGTTLHTVAAGLTDAELLALDIRWVYRHTTPASRLVDAAIRDLYRGHIPAGSLLPLDALLRPEA